MSYRVAIHLRYVLILNVIASLAPAVLVKGREHDPMLNASWWPREYHSAVIVVSIAAVLSTGLVYLLLRRNITKWWAYCLCGAFAGTFPGAFYLVAMPKADLAKVPGFYAVFGVMMIGGFICGFLVGFVIYGVAGRRRALTWT